MDRLPLAQEGRDLDRAVRWRHRTPRCRFRLSACRGCPPAQPRFHLRRGRYGSAVDSVECRPQWRRAEAGDEARRAARRAFQARRIPSGRLIAFTVAHGHISTEVWTKSLDGDGGTKLGEGTRRSSRPTAAPSIGLGGRREGNDTLMRVGIDEHGAPTGTPEAIQQFAGNFVGGFSIARNGTAVLWLFRGSANLWTVDVAADGEQGAPPVRFDRRRRTQHLSKSFAGWTHRISSVRLGSAANGLGDERGWHKPPGADRGLSFGVWAPQWSPDSKRCSS